MVYKKNLIQIWYDKFAKPNLSQKFVFLSGSESVWKFTQEMIKRGVYQAGTGNSLFSPISILITLNMILLGVTGNTEREMREALGR